MRLGRWLPSALTVEGCRAAPLYDAVEKEKNKLSQAHERAGKRGRDGWEGMEKHGAVITTLRRGCARYAARDTRVCKHDTVKLPRQKQLRYSPTVRANPITGQ